MFLRPIVAAEAQRQKPPPLNYRAQLDYMYRSDFGVRTDVLIRYGAVLIAVALLTFYTASPLFVIWVAAYLGTNFAYYFALTRTAGLVRRGRFQIVSGLFILTSSLFALMPLTMWLGFATPEMKLFSGLAIAAHAMFNLSRHQARAVTLYWDTISMVITLGAIGIFEAWHAPTHSASIITVFAMIVISVYYVQAQFRTVKSHEEAIHNRDMAIAAQKMQAIGQVTAGVAHDFNNILTVVLGNIELARMAQGSDERDELLDAAHSSAGQAATLVAQMLAFVRKSPMQVTSVRISEFLHRLETPLAAIIPESLSLTIEVPDQEICVKADEALLQSALLHLVLNARDAVGDTAGTIHLSVRRSQDNFVTGAPGNFVLFEVRDSGPGISPDIADAVLEPFFTTKRADGGSGLGLSMVKGFAEQLGGGLVLGNLRTGGLSVQFTLPECRENEILSVTKPS